MPDGFLLKSVVFKLISKEISRADHEYMIPRGNTEFGGRGLVLQQHLSKIVSSGLP